MNHFVETSQWPSALDLGLAVTPSQALPGSSVLWQQAQTARATAELLPSKKLIYSTEKFIFLGNRGAGAAIFCQLSVDLISITCTVL